MLTSNEYVKIMEEKERKEEEAELKKKRKLEREKKRQEKEALMAKKAQKQVAKTARIRKANAGRYITSAGILLGAGGAQPPQNWRS